MPRPNPLTPEVQAAFLAELRRGALVVPAAARVGVALSTLYWRRKQDAAFDSEWTAAAEASFGFVWEERKRRRGQRRGRGRGRGRVLVRVATKRRVRFGATRRGLYLGSLERSCDTKNSARRAGVWPSTVYRAMKRDPGFARSSDEALERGYVRLERVAALERRRSAERMKRFLDRGFEPTGEPTSDPGRLLRPLDLYRRPERPRREGGRPPPRALSPFEAVDALERKLRHMDMGRAAPSLSGP